MSDVIVMTFHALWDFIKKPTELGKDNSISSNKNRHLFGPLFDPNTSPFGADVSHRWIGTIRSMGRGYA